MLVQLPSLRKREYKVLYYVPYETKETAKKQGCKWNPTTKNWYRTFTCYNDEDIKQVSASQCGIRVLDYELIKESIEPGQTVRLQQCDRDDLLKSGCIILEE